MAQKNVTAVKSILYAWQGVNKNGEKVSGETKAKTIALLKADLRRQGIIAKKVKKKRIKTSRKSKAKIKGSDITIFARQLATMIKAGIPLIQGFDIVSNGVTNQNLQKLINTIKTDVESGKSFTEALQKHPKHFNDLFVNLIGAGEQSGSLDTMLDKVATYKEKFESLVKKIKKAMFYPAAIMVVAFVVTAALLIFVVPQFESLFKGFGADLPFMTQFVVKMSEFFQSYWYLIFGSVFGAIFAFVKAREKSEKFSHGVDRAILKIPVIGNILYNAAVARFARTLAITFTAGLPLVDALTSVAGATGNYVFTDATLKIRDKISSGLQLQEAIRSVQVFPPMVIQLTSIGEESGKLEEMLTKLADFYEEDVDNAVDGLSSLIEPIIMAILGVLIGGLVIAMYLPIFQLGSVV